MSPERDDYGDDDERDEFAPRSIFSAGWFRAVLVLTVLAIVAVISLPYLLNWFEPASPPRVAKPAEVPKPAPAAVPTPAPAPAAPATPEVKPATPVPAPASRAVAPAPAAPTPAPKAAVDKAAAPASPEPARKAPEKSAPKATAEKATGKAPEEKVVAKASVDKAVPKPAAAPERAPVKAVEKVAAKPADKPVPTRVVAKGDAPSPPAAVATAKPSSEGASGSYWIQVGAFKEQKNADMLAKSLRDAGFPVQVTAITRGSGGDGAVPVQRHELFVTDASVDKVNAALKGQGTAQSVSGGVAVRPPFSLQEAMTVSKRLTDQGLKVVIRPAGGLSAAAPSQPSLHAVRAGAYPNRTSALGARAELAAKGHQGFLAEGPAK